MVVLGISFTHDGTLSIIKDGIHHFSIAEERLNRKKAYIGFPFMALRYVIEHNIITSNEIDKVAISTSVFKKEWAFTFAFQLTEDKTYYDLQNEAKPENFHINDTAYTSIQSDDACKTYVLNKIKNILGKVDIDAPIECVNHHLCHASAAYYSSGFENAIAITMDGEGDLASSTINICKNGTIQTLHTEPISTSFGNFYSYITKECGFKMSRHEGKITGLAAYGNCKKQYEIFCKRITTVDGNITLNKAGILNKIFGKKAASIKALFEDFLNTEAPLENKELACIAQTVLEKKGLEYIAYWIKTFNMNNVVLAGGIFANVKFNQAISELDTVDAMYVFPDMGDGGNAFGAAAYCYYAMHGFDPKVSKIPNVYLGPNFENDAIETILNQHSIRVEFTRSESVAKETAKLIASNKIVGWFQGRMEYGPRALGNRSIIASPVDRDINTWLNKRMQRTEFMPFAPSCLYEHADNVFEIPKEAMKYPAEFMTVTFKMKEQWANKAPAVAHIDQTARPQLVTSDANPKYHALLREYYEITGLPLFINTSFNVHEEPIVCTPQEGLKSLLNGVIDIFVCENYICRLKAE